MKLSKSIDKKIDDVILFHREGKLAQAKNVFDSMVDCEPIFGLIKSDFVYYLPINDTSKVLEIGSGLGQCSFNIAQSSGEVLSVDMEDRNIQFSKIRNEFSGGNVKFQFIEKIDDLKNIYIDYFDVIIMNDYKYIYDENYFDILDSLLKKGGSIYINKYPLFSLNSVMKKYVLSGVKYITYPNRDVPRIIVPMADNNAIDFGIRILLSERQIIKKIYCTLHMKIFIPIVKYILGSRFVIAKK